MLEKGCKWIVGDGKSINIWKDPWLNRAPLFRVISPRPENTSCEYVADMLDSNLGGRNASIVREGNNHYKKQAF